MSRYRQVRRKDHRSNTPPLTRKSMKGREKKKKEYIPISKDVKKCVRRYVMWSIEWNMQGQW